MYSPINSIKLLNIDNWMLNLIVLSIPIYFINVEADSDPKAKPTAININKKPTLSGAKWMKTQSGTIEDYDVPYGFLLLE